MSVRIAIDAAVLLAAVDAALRHPRVSRVVVFGSAKALRRFELPASSKLDDVEVPLADRGPAGRVWWHTVGLPRALRARGAGALLALSGGGFGPRGCRSTLLIQQSLPFCPEALARHGLAARVRLAGIGRMMAASAKRSDRVIVQTPTMKRWVADGLGVPPERVDVVEPDVVVAARGAPDPALEELRRVARDGRAALYVGNDSPYKNLGILAPAADDLARRLPGATLFATVPPGHPALRSPHVRPIPLLSRAALWEAYALATAVVMPSLVETVGLPMLEAAAAGTPVAAADRTYAHDVCGDAALFFDPLSPSDLAVKLESLLTDEALRVRLVASGKRNVERRAAGRPYDRMIDIALGDAAGENA